MYISFSDAQDINLYIKYIDFSIIIDLHMWERFTSITVWKHDFVKIYINNDLDDIGHMLCRDDRKCVETLLSHT